MTTEDETTPPLPPPDALEQEERQEDGAAATATPEEDGWRPVFATPFFEEVMHVLEIAFSHPETGEAARTLFEGRRLDQWRSREEAERTLCHYLVYATRGDATLINGAFRCSALWSPTWDEMTERGLTHGQEVIEAELTHCGVEPGSAPLPEPKRKRGRPRKVGMAKVKVVVLKKEEEEVRATFILKRGLLETFRDYCYTERLEQKEAIEKILRRFFSRIPPENLLKRPKK